MNKERRLKAVSPGIILWRIYVPLSKPIIALQMLGCFQAAWNNLQGPLIYITTKEKYTVSLALAQLRTVSEGRMELQMAGTMMVIIPVLLVYFIAQKFFVKKDLDAGVKG